MTDQPDADLVVLHGLRCCGAASTERLAAIVDPLVPVDVEDVLLDLATRGLVTHDRGTFGGWRLTSAGRVADTEWITVELDGADAHSEIHAAYTDFLDLNQQALDICSAWQLRSFEPLVVNDHSDAAYDAGVLRRLAALHTQAAEVCDRLAARLHRFAHYGPRLTSALDRAGRGEWDMVADTLDSYHTVWCQLHEDLLATLGIERDAPGW